MALLRWIRTRRDGKLVAAHVEALLASVSNRVVQSTLPRAATLPRAEARGYIRAKASIILTIAADAPAARPETAIPDRLLPVVLHAAVERATAAVLEQLVRPRTERRSIRRAA